MTKFHLRSIPGHSSTPTIRKSVMIRDLNGEISFWDKNSEAIYGFNRTTAVGNKSHLLLKTIFPEPLHDINSRLLNRRRWKGELIHTCVDGQQIKVLSEWAVVHEGDGGGPLVRETNAYFTTLEPETAQLKESSLLDQNHKTFFALSKKTILLSTIFTFTLIVSLILVWLVTHTHAIHPLQ